MSSFIGFGEIKQFTVSDTIGARVLKHSFFISIVGKGSGKQVAAEAVLMMSLMDFGVDGLKFVRSCVDNVDGVCECPLRLALTSKVQQIFKIF